MIIREDLGNCDLFTQETAKTLLNVLQNGFKLFELKSGFGLINKSSTLIIIPAQKEITLLSVQDTTQMCWRLEVIREGLTCLKHLNDKAKHIYPPHGNVPMLLRGKYFDVYIAPADIEEA